MGMETKDFVTLYVESFKNYVAIESISMGQGLDMSDERVVQMLDLAAHMSLGHLSTIATEFKANQLLEAMFAKIAHGWETER